MEVEVDAGSEALLPNASVVTADMFAMTELFRYHLEKS